MSMIKEGSTCTFQILFTSDVHGAFRDYNYYLDKAYTTGFSKIAPFMQRDRDLFNGKTFVVDVGDIIQGNGSGVLAGNEKFRPHPLLAAYDAFGYDIVSIGNHEFNYGIPELLNAFNGYKGEKLCGNVFDSDGHLINGFKAYTIKTLDIGLRIAFIGMVSPNCDTWDKSNFEAAKYKARNAAEATHEVIDEIKQKDLADVIILLGHMHTDNELDRDGSGAKDVVKLNPEIDLFIGAHFHTIVGAKDAQCVLHDTVKFAENKSSAATYGKALITAYFENGRWIVKDKTGSYADSDVKTDIVEIINYDNAFNITTEAHDYLVNYMRNTQIGTLQGGALVPPPEIPGSHAVILQPTPLIDLLTKIIKEYSGADIVATGVNDFSINCDKGPITYGKIAQMYIYDNNTFYQLSMTGEQIIKWMEWSYSYFGTLKDGKPDSGSAVDLSQDLTIPYGTRKVYLHDKFGGIDYDVDLTKKVGERIKNIKMEDGTVIILDKLYTVAVSNYRATTNLLVNTTDGVFGPGEKVAIMDKKDEIMSPMGSTNMLEWIAEYIKEKGGTIYNTYRDNWRFINLDWNAEYRKKAVELITNGKLNYDYKTAITIDDVRNCN